MAVGARRFSGQVESRAAPGTDSSVGQSILDRLRSAHHAYAPAGADGRVPAHASSAVRNGKAYLFSGFSEAGKTTIARLAPPDVALLTDEASYVRRVDDQYLAYGTPFAGELGEPGKNISAPIAAVYLLKKAPENRISNVEPAEATRRLLRNILFFAHDAELVRLVFESACAFVAAVPVYQLSFFPDERVWDLIG